MSTAKTVVLIVLIIASNLLLTSYLIHDHSQMDEMNETFIILDQSQNIDNSVDCSMDNWLDDILPKFQPLIAYHSLNRQYLTNTSDIYLELHLSNESEAIMLVITDSITFNQSLSYWNQLSHGSLYIQKVNTINDIINMGRYSELTQWNHAVYYYGKRMYNLQEVYVGDILCSKCGCIIQKEYQIRHHDTGLFYQIAKTTKTDKITKHYYNILYDKQMTEFFYLNKGIFLEIGLGCGMAYGAGESAKIWTKLFNNVHFVEFNAECVEHHKEEINKANYTVHVGDQANVTFLEEIKTNYILNDPFGVDIIIDDGGHWNHQIIKSFTSLWHVLNPNGLYFIEDYGESTYDKNYLDSQPVKEFGQEKPGTAAFFIRNLMYNLFCKISNKSCFDIKYIETRLDICVIRKI